MIASMAARSSRFGAKAGSGAHNLPVPLTSLVGRTHELERVGEILRRTRMVTVTGPGGVGKTRLAVAVAARVAGRPADGVWLVDLTSADADDDVAPEVGRVLGIALARSEGPADTLRSYLRGRDALLVLDNCEHVVESCARLAGDLLSSCVSLRILATSRELLGVSGETVWRLEPLEPEDAYRLFVERARQRQPEFVPDEVVGALIGRLCERLDRLPLAIELAAARVDVMSVAEIVASVDAGVGEAGGAWRFAPPRHRTVRAAVQWSYELLGADEQEAFRYMAVFVGGFDAAAARSVAPGMSVDLLARLVGKSLVAVERGARGATRYRLLETVRDYAYERLVAAGELDEAREQHLRHFAGLADGALEEWLTTGRQWLVNELDEDYENVRVSLEWAAISDPATGMRVLAGTRDLFYKFGQDEGLALARRLLARSPAADRSRAMALLTAGELANAVGEADAARGLLAEGRELSARLGEGAVEAWIAWFQGVTEMTTGNPEAGRDHLEHSRALHQRLGIRVGEARALEALGGTYQFAGEYEPARELHEQALEIFVAEQNLWGQASCHTFLGMIAQATSSDPARASSHYLKAVELFRPSHDTTLLPVALLGQASVLVRHDPARALTVLAAASAIRNRAGGEFQSIFKARADETRAAAVARVGPDADRLWAQGWRLDVDEVTALAFGVRRRRPSSPTGLSARELDVVRLVCDGLANKEIAARLQLSVRTIEVHVRHALAKLGLENRTQLAIWARNRLN